jgi:hypothetical protein
VAIETSGDPFHPNACPACRRPLTWARVQTSSGPKVIAIETCTPGRGNLGLAVAMFSKPGELPTAEVVTTGTRYRAHNLHCPGGKGRGAGGSFTGGERRRKERPR